MGFLLGVLLYESSMGMEVPSLGIPIKSTNLRAQGQNLRESWDISSVGRPKLMKEVFHSLLQTWTRTQPLGCGMQVSSNNACHAWSFRVHWTICSPGSWTTRHATQSSQPSRVVSKKTPSGHPHMFFFLKTRVSVTNKETMNKPSALLWLLRCRPPSGWIRKSRIYAPNGSKWIQIACSIGKLTWMMNENEWWMKKIMRTK